MKKAILYTVLVLSGFVSTSFCARPSLVDPDLSALAKGSTKKTPEVPLETKSEFLPGLWESVKKGLGTPSEDELLEKSEIEAVKAWADYEDVDEKYWEKNIDALKKRIEAQDIVASLVKNARELGFIWAKKLVFEYLEQVAPSMVTTIPSVNRKGLSAQEKKFRTNRIEGDKEKGHIGVRDALGKFLGEDLSLQTVNDSVIAFAGTGGGYRAMILTAGYLEGLEKIGLLDATMYTAGLSGSSWMIGPWISSGSTVGQYKQSLLNKISSKQFNVMKLGPGILSSSENIATLVKYLLWPKFLWGQPIRSIDFYGYLLGQVLLGKDGYKKHISDQLITIQSGRYPFPIYTAVSMSKKDDESYSYDWYEFNPVEVLVNIKEGKDDLEGKYLSVPIKAFGSEFNAGKSVSTGFVGAAPEQMFGYWLGTFGSAFAINSKDIDAYVARGVSGLKQSVTSLDGLINISASLLISMIQSIEGVGTARISPAQIFNPFRGYSDTPAKWLKNKKYLTLVDAGVSNNIPLIPLLWPERKIKFIIIGESSTSAMSARNLKMFFEEAKSLYGYEYERVDDGSNATLRFYKDKRKYSDEEKEEGKKEGPRIIYLTYIKDPKLMSLTGVTQLSTQEKVEREELRRFIKSEKLETFDPIACIDGKDGNPDFCHTLNFEYTTDQFKQLSGIAEFNVRANKEVITAFIRDELHNEEMIDYPAYGNP